MKTQTPAVIINWSKACSAPPKRLFLIFGEPELRPPVYDEMVADMGNIINKVVAPYVSQGVVELHFDELVAECWHKTTKMNHEGLILRCQTRTEFFAQFKTAIANHVRSLVQKYIYTEKRTGVKPPPKDKRYGQSDHAPRLVEIRMDDPENNVQVSEIEAGDNSTEFKELLEEVASRLNYMEQGVLNQLLSPNEAALFYARMEAEIGREDGEPLRVRIRQEHLAKGLGMSIEQFRELHDAIKEKCLYMKSQKENEDPRYTAAMATLIQFFGIQIPRSIDEVTRKRAVMIAARHQYDRMKDNEGIKNALRTCEIPVPEAVNNRIKCFGVMFQKHHRTCENCGVKEACELKAANFGIAEITMSHKLLGARHARMPVVRPSRMTDDAALADEREEEIMAFLDENFRRVTQQGLVNFRHQDRTAAPGVGNEQMIFTLENVSPLRLRFINPAEELKPSLKPESTVKGGRRSWFLPSDLSTDQSINLIRAHAQITFTKA